MGTILIWLGSGFAFSIGVFVGIIAAGLMIPKRNKIVEAQVNELLKERNEIGVRQAIALELIAERLTEMRR